MTAVFNPDRMRPDAIWTRTPDRGTVDGRFVIEVVTPAGEHAIWYARGFENTEEAERWLLMTTSA